MTIVNGWQLDVISVSTQRNCGATLRWTDERVYLHVVLAGATVDGEDARRSIGLTTKAHAYAICICETF
jgi:hypothetical protein